VKSGWEQEVRKEEGRTMEKVEEEVVWEEREGDTWTNLVVK
jgi:hypothetical protein